ncbi:MAG TPA: IPT/TIG domain-containing protein [Thermoanaerobaculia bacterium]|nr:IPT/TIG domain-containing protein [Thermoanaerobaculia bacterium]
MKRAFLALFLTLSVIPNADASLWKWFRRANKPAATAPSHKRMPVAATVAAPSKKQMADIDSDAFHGELEAEGANPPGKGKNNGKPQEMRLKKASGKVFDLRHLPRTPVQKFERPEYEAPEIQRGTVNTANGLTAATEAVLPPPVAMAAAPAPIMNFDGLDYNTFGNGHPPDTVGDVGKDYYVQSINSSIGIYRKSDGARVAGVPLNTFMAQGNFGNLCDNNNFGDPVVLYDTFEDRWIITDFAFQLSNGNVVNPPGAFQCFAVSMNDDPVSGGWNFYSIPIDLGLGDYPKFGIWPDGLYMSVNAFGYLSGGAYLGARAYALNKTQMYAGQSSVQVVSFDMGESEFTALPSNARLQTGTPPPGTPNYFVSTWQYLDALTVYKFHVDWDSISQSTFTGPETPLSPSQWPNQAVANSPSLGGNALDVVHIRAMMQNQYTNFAGVESLWATHTVRRAVNGTAAPRWYQLNVTGGTVADNVVQAATWDPDGANTINRFIPSLAINRLGDLALGYNTSSSTTKPALRYAGRLAGDPLNTFSFSEQLLVQGAGTQVGNCGGTCTRWGDYAAMTLDPDGCTFWFTGQYYATDGLDHHTRIGSFAYPGCTPVGAGGTISGTVTSSPGGTPISGATVKLGIRTATTNGSGGYSFNVPAGTYPSITAMKPGFTSGSDLSIPVTDGGTTTRDFALASTLTNGCLTDTSKADFELGVPDTVDTTTTPNSVLLSRATGVDQFTVNVTGSGVALNTSTWAGQSFTPSVTGVITKADIRLFCSSCTVAPFPNLTLSVRATAAGLPVGADLGTATITGFNGGAAAFYAGTFATPIPVTAGVQYALVVRPTGAPGAGTYAIVRSVVSATGQGYDVYPGGARLNGATSGTVWTIPTNGGVTNDLGFRVYIDSGYTPAGELVRTLDSSPAGGLTPIWGTFSWTATQPANTSVKFQIAASNSETGPFNFVGPDETAATFFTTSGASLSQFYNQRYLQYKAILSTTDTAVTPELADVSACFVNADCSGTIEITPSATSVCSESGGNTATGPAGATSYSWSITNGSITSGSTSQTVTYTAGTSGVVGLVLNIIEAGGCQKSAQTSITINPIPDSPTITPAGPVATCANPGVLLTSSAPAGNQWYRDGQPILGATADTFTATTAGDYSVAVTLLGCEGPSSESVTVTINPLPTTPSIGAAVNDTGSNDKACPAQALTLTASASANAETYAWYKDNVLIAGETNATYDATSAGTYSVEGVNSCGAGPRSADYIVQDPTPAKPSLTPGGPLAFCEGGSVTLTSDNATGIQWYRDNAELTGETAQTLLVTTSGSYTAQLNGSGCHSAYSDSIVVVVNPIPEQPAITPGGPTTFCAGGSVTLTSSTETGNQWLLDGNPIGGANAQQYVATLNGNYTVTTTANGCISPQSAGVSVTVNPLPAAPAITPGGPTTFCTGGSVTLTSNSASGNQWLLNGNPIGGATSQQYVATASGNYTVTTTDGNSCTSLASAATVVTVNPIPSTPGITPGGPTTFCAGGSVTLTSSSASGNQWSLNGTPIGGATAQQYVATLAGNYTATVTANGCTSPASVGVGVTVLPAPATPTIVAGGPTTFCSPGSVTLTSSSATGNQWYRNGTPISGATNQTYQVYSGDPVVDPDHMYGLVSGSYTVVVTANGCSSSPSNAIAVNAMPTPAKPSFSTDGSLFFCQGGSVTFTADMAIDGITYQWYRDNSPIATATNRTYAATTSGNYTVMVSIGTCSSPMSDGIFVFVTNPPAAPTVTAFGSTTVCDATVSMQSSEVSQSNQWYRDGVLIPGATGPFYDATVSGSYTARIDVTCASAMSAPVVVTINHAPPAPSISVGGPTTFCAGGGVTLTSSSESGNQWYLNGTPIGGATNMQYVATASGNYTVTVAGGGCTSAPSAATTVSVTPAPATPTINGTLGFCTGSNTTLTSSSASGNQWYFNGDPIGGATSQQYVAAAAGSYTVIVTANGCTSAASPAAVVSENPIPSAPTINASGLTTFCVGGSVTLTSSSSKNNQWYLNGNPIGGATNQQYLVMATGDYTVVETTSGCSSAPSAATTVTVKPAPSTPTINAGGPTTFCAGGSVTLTSTSASGNQWFLNGNPIGGASNQQYLANANGDYTVVVTTNGCSSAPSTAMTVTVNPIPSTPTINAGGPTTFCTGGSVTLTSSSEGGNQWFLNGNPIGGATSQQYVAGANGNYTVVVTMSGCSSAASAATTVTVNPLPSTPTINAGGPTTFCTGGSVTLTSSSATGNQWFLNGNPIGGATGQQYVAAANGNYSVAVTTSGCSSAASAATTVTATPIPSTPTINASGPTTFCTGGSVTLTSSSASGNQWLMNGNPIGGATSQQYVATTAGDYSVIVTTSGCSSAASAATTVTINPIPNATITAPASVLATSTGNAASVADAGTDATYAWSITNGTITAGTGTRTITFTAGTAGTLALNVTVTANGCSDTKSANVSVTSVAPAVTVTSVTPDHGPYLGGTPVTIAGTGFTAGATVTFGGVAATNVVVVNATSITAKTPAHAGGAVNVTVTNTNTSSGTANNAFTYVPRQFDPNGDNVVDPSDIFYLINYLFLGGPAPQGGAGMVSGDANGDGVVDPADIFYAVKYLFLNGQAPYSKTPGSIATTSAASRLSGSIALGKPVARGEGRYTIPVIVKSSDAPQALALRLRFSDAANDVSIHRAGAAKELQPVFEVSRAADNTLSYLVAFDESAGLRLSNDGVVVAELEVAGNGSELHVAIDRELTMLASADGTQSATAANGRLTIGAGVALERPRLAPKSEKE